MREVSKTVKLGRPKCFQKHEVLDKAIEVFADHGYEGTSIQDLVDRMGINRFSLYEEFGGKNGLFLAALEQYHSMRRERIAAHFASPGPKLDLIYKHLQNIQSDARKGGAYGCMMVNSAVELARNDPEVASRISHHYDLIEAIFAEVLVSAELEGEIELKWSPNAVARFLLNVSRGLRVMVTYERDQEVFDDIVSIALTVINPNFNTYKQIVT